MEAPLKDCIEWSRFLGLAMNRSISYAILICDLYENGEFDPEEQILHFHNFKEFSRVLLEIS